MEEEDCREHVVTQVCMEFPWDFSLDEWAVDGVCVVFIRTGSLHKLHCPILTVEYSLETVKQQHFKYSGIGTIQLLRTILGLHQIRNMMKNQIM